MDGSGDQDAQYITTRPQVDCVWPSSCYKCSIYSNDNPNCQNADLLGPWYYVDTESCFDQGPWSCTAADGTCFLSAQSDCSVQTTVITCPS